MILSEVIERIKQEAIELGGPQYNDSEVIIELILPKCIQALVQDVVNSEAGHTAFLKDHLLVVSNGTAALPAGVDHRLAKYITITTSTQPYASYEKEMSDYVNKTAFFPTFHVSENLFYFRPPGSSITAFTGAINILAVTYPQLPSLISSSVVIDPSILEELIYFTACVLIGKIEPSKIGIDALPNGR